MTAPHATPHNGPVPGPAQISALSAGKVLVLGDLMLDHYVSGGVTRVSEEAPVPILRVLGERWTPGGGANVAANVAALGGLARLVGVAGDDDAGRRLAEVLESEGDRLEAQLVIARDRPTIIKTRYMGGQHQMLRVDREIAGPLHPDTQSTLLAAFRTALDGCNTVVLSDYAKGVLTDGVLAAVISEARAAGAYVIVDPKRPDWRGYAGADLITPNRRELSLATGIACDTDAGCAAAAAAAMSLTGADILLTRSELGVSLYRKDGAPLHLPADAREVFDVSGAGDTVAAALALALSSGAALEAAVAIANIAAGLVVAKRGTATVSQSELTAALPGAGWPPRPGLRDAANLDEIRKLRAGWREEGLVVGFTNGCFDLLHPGHVSLLTQAAAACDRLIVGLNTDASVKRLKGPARPVQTEAARAAVISAVRGVDAVVLFGDDTPLALIEAIEPDVLIKGADYEEADIVGADFVKARGGRIVRAALTEGHSTSRLVDRIGGADS